MRPSSDGIRTWHVSLICQGYQRGPVCNDHNLRMYCSGLIPHRARETGQGHLMSTLCSVSSLQLHAAAYGKLHGTRLYHCQRHSGRAANARTWVIVHKKCLPNLRLNETGTLAGKWMHAAVSALGQSYHLRTHTTTRTAGAQSWQPRDSLTLTVLGVRAAALRLASSAIARALGRVRDEDALPAPSPLLY